jgi:5-hydroxyisourate hydrolase-like protein (transthyretin family)
MLRTACPAILLTAGMLGFTSVPTKAAIRIEGLVQAGGGPVANSTVALWGASSAEPRQLAQARTNGDGRFEINSQDTPSGDVILYLVAKGGTHSHQEQR